VHSWDHADSEYVLHVGVDHTGSEFIGNKYTRLHNELYVLVQIINPYYMYFTKLLN